MTQPSFVPIAEADQVRPARSLKVPGSWSATRPAELRVPARPTGPGRGTPGPDQGFALQLAHRFADRLVLSEGESAEDVLLGCALIASKRAGLFGRAPCIHDVTAALSLWGFLMPELPDLADERRAAFRGVAHDYVMQRALVDRIPLETLRLSAEALVLQSLDGWRVLLGITTEGQGAVTPVG